MTDPDEADLEGTGSRQDGWRDRLASIAAFGRAMNAARSAADVAEFVAEEIRLATDASSVSISRWEPAEAVLRTLVNVGDLADWEERRPVDETYPVEALLAEVIDSGTALVCCADDPTCPPQERALLRSTGKHSSLTVAVRYAGRVWGELYLTRGADKPPFTGEDLEVAGGMAGFVAMAFAQGERLDAVSQVAFRDPLTGLANRAAVDDALAAAFEERRRGGRHIGLVLVDVNGLKSVNDLSGHDAGDRLLVAVAGVVRSVAASVEGALAARLGGDEFCVLLRDTTAERTLRLAEDLCVEAWRVALDGVSCGVACTAEPQLDVVDSPRRLLRIADAAQYRAKRARSVRPVVAGREVHVPTPRVASGDSRRTYREGAESLLARLLDGGLAVLDHAVGEGVQRRLRALAESASAVLGAAAWYTASATPGSDTLVTRDGESYRPSDTAPVWDRDELVGAEWPIADYPQTAAVLAGGAFVAVNGVAGGDPGEQAVLADSGYDAVAAVGGTDSSGTRWLLEIYADDLSGDLTGMDGALRALVAAALADGAGLSAGGSGRTEARLAALVEMGRTLQTAHSYESIVRLVADGARTALDASVVTLTRWDPATRSTRGVVMAGSLPTGERRPEDEVFLAEDFPTLYSLVYGRRGACFRLDDPEPAPEHDLLRAAGMHSAVAVPVSLESSHWGVLTALRRAEAPPFTDADLLFAQAVADLVAVGLVHADRAAVVADLAYTDDLTGLANRRAVDDRLDEAFERRGRDGTVVSVLLLDVNGLKRVNDRSGHEAGDALLVGVARVLENVSAERPGCLPARLGGDEMAVVLVGASADEAVQMAGEVCRRALRVPGSRGVACGVASTGEPLLASVESPKRLLRLADAAQYRAKRVGSTRPVVAGRTAPASDMDVGATRSGDRRVWRGRLGPDPGAFLAHLLDALDASGATSTFERLDAVVDAAAERLDAAAWYLSSAEPDSDALRVVTENAYRSSEHADPSWGEWLGSEWSLAEYPQSVRTIAGGGFVTETEASGNDPAEETVLLASGYTAMLAAGGQAPDGTRWLAEIFVDALSPAVSGLAPAFRAAIACALLPSGEAAGGLGPPCGER